MSRCCSERQWSRSSAPSPDRPPSKRGGPNRWMTSEWLGVRYSGVRVRGTRERVNHEEKGERVMSEQVDEVKLKSGIGRIWEARPGKFSWAHPDGSEGCDCPSWEAAEAALLEGDEKARVERVGITAGPWHFERISGHYEIWPKDDGQPHGAVCDRVFRKDDARAIAAVPELIEALRLSVAAIDLHGELETADRERMEIDAVRAARAALAKTTGGGL